MTLIEGINLGLLIGTLIWSIISHFLNKRDIKKINERNNFTQVQFELEFNTHKEFCEILSRYVQATIDLFRMVPFEEELDDKKRERKLKELSDFAMKVHDEFTIKFQAYKPFISEEIEQKHIDMILLCNEQVKCFDLVKMTLTRKEEEQNVECQMAYERTFDIMKRHNEFNDMLRKHFMERKSLMG